MLSSVLQDTKFHRIGWQPVKKEKQNDNRVAIVFASNA